MEMPKVRNVLNDERAGVRYEVLAYRRLTEGELLTAVRFFLSQRKAKRPKRGTVVTIVSIIGHDEPVGGSAKFNRVR